MKIKCNFCRAGFLYPIDKLEYQFSYNIRGWLKEINSMASLSESGSPNDLFAFKLNYNTVDHPIGTTVTPLYNGNISETYWKSGSDNFVRKYGYVYDNLNRLTDAIYQKPILGNPFIQQVTNSYNEEMAYDRNGNITSLYRNGYLDADGGPIYPIDNLEYQYSHNKLLKVIDHTNSLDGFRDGQNPNGVTEPDYFYDANGNMTQDWNKGIDAITYNHMNLPTRINFKVDQGEKFISYIYNALGQKVSKQVVHQSSTEQVNTLTEYLSGFQYVGGIMQYFPTAEGYVSVTNGKDFDYVYNYTDHLGNIRVSYTMPKGTTTLTILEENHYYPFGMKHANYGDGRHDYVRNPDGTGYAIIDEVHRNKYQYKYNGKEYQDELSLNFYDYGARNYDPAIGRWMNMDPLAETSRRFSPYTYALNNPVFFIDPDGMEAKPPTYTRTYASQNEDKRSVSHESYTRQNNKNGSFVINKTTLTTSIDAEGKVGKSTMTHTSTTYTPVEKSYTDEMGTKVTYTDYDEKVNSSSSRDASKAELASADGGYFTDKVKDVAQKVNENTNFISEEAKAQQSGQSEYKTQDLNQTFTELGLPLSRVHPELPDTTVGKVQEIFVKALDWLSGNKNIGTLIITPLQKRQ